MLTGQERKNGPKGYSLEGAGAVELGRRERG